MEYILFYDYITAELCINKDKPELKCNGTCHLKKELSEASDSENQILNDKNNRPLTAFSFLFFENFQKFNLNVFYEYISQEYLAYPNLYSHLTTDFIFHPPIRF